MLPLRYSTLPKKRTKKKFRFTLTIKSKQLWNEAMFDNSQSTSPAAGTCNAVRGVKRHGLPHLFLQQAACSNILGHCPWITVRNQSWRLVNISELSYSFFWEPIPSTAALFSWCFIILLALALRLLSWRVVMHCFKTMVLNGKRMEKDGKGTSIPHLPQSSCYDLSIPEVLALNFARPTMWAHPSAHVYFSWSHKPLFAVTLAHATGRILLQ